MSSCDESYSTQSTSRPTSRPTSRRRATRRIISVDDSTSAALGGGGHFPHKLYGMLQCSSESEQRTAISWTHDGTAFLIHDSEILMQAVVPKFFNQTQLRSFTRQLNLWGFSRITTAEANGWTHPHFVRGYVDGLKNVKRIEVKGISSKVKGKSRKTKKSGRTALSSPCCAKEMAQPASKPDCPPGESRITKEHAKESDPVPSAARNNNNLPMTQLDWRTTQQWVHHIASAIPQSPQPLVSEFGPSHLSHSTSFQNGPNDRQGNCSAPSTATGNFCPPQSPPRVSVWSYIAEQDIQPIPINQPVAATRASSCSEPSVSDLTYLASLLEESEEDEFDRAIRQMFCAK